MQVTKTDGVCFECKKSFIDGYQIILNRKLYNKLNLCTCCASKLYLGLANSFVPKSPKNVINRKFQQDVKNKKI